jgi:trans-aconitate methyltransferase
MADVKAPEEPLLYTSLAEWWPLLSAPEEYGEEAATYAHLLRDAAPGPVRSLLELGAGGGNNASYLKKRFEMTLVDLSEDMLEVSRRLNPECEHVQGDMRSIRLERTFDAVFIHDAIAYITTVGDLEAVFNTVRIHLQEGGVALFCPDHIRETFVESTDHGGRNDGRRGLRYLEWIWDPDPSDTQHLTDYAYLLRDEDGHIEVVRDRHVCGLFAEAQWIEALRDAGFQARSVPITFLDEDREWIVFVAVLDGRREIRLDGGKSTAAGPA